MKTKIEFIVKDFLIGKSITYLLKKIITPTGKINNEQFEIENIEEPVKDFVITKSFGKGNRIITEKYTGLIINCEIHDHNEDRYGSSKDISLWTSNGHIITKSFDTWIFIE